MLRLSEKSIEWALCHIEKFGDTDIFPIPFEFTAIKYNWDSIIKPFLQNQDILNWETRPHRRCLTPKNKYGFRIATQLDPLDCIVFTALIGEIGKDIENARISKKENISFSHRFKPGRDGRLYDEDYNWNSFQDYCKEVVQSGEYQYVVVADIADFYPRIYSHPLENALFDCTSKRNHALAIKNMLKSWNFTISFGIPVGLAASRLLAELVLDDIDRGLLGEGIKHCRYVDDYRIFCKTEKEAFEKLSFLANILYENQALTLQQNKTTILPIDNFYERYLQTEERRELNSLSVKMKELINDLGIEEDPYQDIDYDDLSLEDKEIIKELNLVEILNEQINNCENPDISLLRFVLRRLGQFGNDEPVEFLLDNIDKLYPVFKDVIRYLQELRTINSQEKQIIGERLLTILNSSIAGHLEYHRMWIFDTFTKNNEWDNEKKFISLYNRYSDEFSRRKLILAMGRSQQKSWFKTNKRDINSFSPWNKRAFLAAASCLPGDEYRHWFDSIVKHLDPLEKAVGEWVKNNKF